jgi:cathepsin A (carboxypeptidase C)
MDWVWDAMEIPREHVKNYTCVDMNINGRFEKGIDMPRNMVPQVKFVLEAGVDVLVYNGNYDLACNTWGNLRWTAGMPWSGQMEYATKLLVPWYANVGGKSVKAGTMKEVRAGKLIDSRTDRKAGRFSFVSIDKAGHMVPTDQPEVSLQMLQTWLKNREFVLTAEVAGEELFGSEQVIMGEL